jgi:hypothetical protein
MASDIEATVILTDEEVEAYQAWKGASPGKFRESACAKLLGLLLDQLSDYLDRAEEDEPEEDNTCPLCIGTGIPQSGPPDVGCCSSCGGSGVKKREPCEDNFDPPDPDDDDGPYGYEGS